MKSNLKNSQITYVLLHGFPSSSFEYSYQTLETFSQNNGNFFVHDHVGFGFSDKPMKDFGYSVQDHADIAIQLWHQVHLQGDCILVAHDMGDSILTEILTRYSRNQATLPSQMRVKHIVFTNGGMALKYYSPKLTQLLLVSRTTGETFNQLMHLIDPTGCIMKQQLLSVFSSSSKGQSLALSRSSQVDHMVTLLRYKKGDEILWKTIRYINDRYACEDRWLNALQILSKENKIPISFLWGQDDPISPPAIAWYVIEKANLTAELTQVKIMPKKGHFLMMEDEEGNVWAEMIIKMTL
jgi:pimeloyl-ACP methyl ester carboxylesterase